MRKVRAGWFLCVLAVAGLTAGIALSGCGGREEPAPAGEPEGTFDLRSPAFADGGPIPTQYTCDGDEVSPPIEWSDLPAGTASLALIMDDPDAIPVAGKVWVHWVLYNIPVRATSLAEGLPADVDLPGGAHNGRGSDHVGYQGPCPPPGAPHRYFIKGYAVDTIIDLPGGATKEQVLKAIDGHVLAIAQLTGTYERQ